MHMVSLRIEINILVFSKTNRTKTTQQHCYVGLLKRKQKKKGKKGKGRKE